MHMATKAISLRLDAYERLRTARRDPNESFSDVIMRAVWKESPRTGRELLARVEAEGASMSEEALDRMEELQASDAPPKDKWRIDAPLGDTLHGPAT